MRKIIIISVFSFLIFACSKNEDLLVSDSNKQEQSNANESEPTKSDSWLKAGTLTLSAPILEKKIYKLLKDFDSSNDFEASGVYAKNGYFYVVFDNLKKIATLKNTLPENSTSNTLKGESGTDSQYEGITYDNYETPNFYVVRESDKKDGKYYPKIYEYKDDLTYQTSKWTDYQLDATQTNKGFEGVAWLRRNSKDYMLGLLEGSGTIIVLEQTSTNWKKVATIYLPTSLGFTDYSDIALSSTGKIAVTSQESSKLWVGQLSSTSWSISGTGTVYLFPRGNDAGVIGAGSQIIYGNVEGVSFITDYQIVVVSDKAKSDQHARNQYKDQSIHIFNL